MEKIEFVNPKTLVIYKNSRWRTEKSDLHEMMESIKQHGILQPILARREDNVVIAGNRRLCSAIKLDLSQVPVIFKKGIDDKELLILNLLENMQRKDISSIEIGMQVYELMHNSSFRMTLSEISTRLGISQNRVKVCLEVYTRLPEEFRKNVVYITNSALRRDGDLPENIVKAILNFNRSFIHLKKDELVELLDIAAKDKLTIDQINLIGHLMVRGASFKQALKNIGLYRVCRVNFVILKTELESSMVAEGTKTQADFFSKILRNYNKNLLF